MGSWKLFQNLPTPFQPSQNIKITIRMKCLLSLPPNVADCFHDISPYSPTHYFCTSDPAHRKLGSGGGTAWLLEACRRAEASDVDFGDWLSQEKRILLHAGGQSRRLPAYASSGKVLTPMPVYRWARGQRIDQLLLDLQLPLYKDILAKAPTTLRTLIASGDVLLRTTLPLHDIPEADVVCYGLWTEAEQATHHGVFFMNREHPNNLDFMLQKPSTRELARLMPTHLALMDIGVWLLSDRAVATLMRKSTTNADDACCPFGFYDLYSQFGCALGAHPSSFDAELADLSVAILPLEGGEFYHFGTSPEIISSTTAIQNLVKDQRHIIKKGVKQHPSVFTQNALIAQRLTEETGDVWIENSCLSEGWHYSSRHILTGIPQNSWQVNLPKGICIDIVPIGEKEYALRPYGFTDAFRGDLHDAQTLYLERPVTQWLKKRGIVDTDLGRTDDLQAANLFPVSASLEQLEKLLHWFISDIPDTATTDEWRHLRRLSADALSTEANLGRLFEQRRSLQRATLPLIAKHWNKSVFYQTNLKDMAQKFADKDLQLPVSLPVEAPLLVRVHDAMFRSEVLRNTDAAAAEQYAGTAFGLLREGLTENVLCHKCQPHRTTYADQIVWGRSSVRIDLAGGWTDTPPYCLMSGGNVVNMAIEMNGQQPLQVYVKPCQEPIIICRSIDLSAMERITTYEELQQFNKVGSPFSIPKAAMALAGFMPGYGIESFPTLQKQLEAFGCGIEITLLSAIPAGSGLGTSSILAATVLGALSDFCGLGWDKNEICNRTLVLEQLLTTGGGWQDQYGGILHGVKLLQTAPGFDQNAVARWLPETLFTDPELRPCHLLYYTGITRTAKNILTEIVRGMFLNSTEHLSLLNDMKAHAMSMFETLQLGDFTKYGHLLRQTWMQNKTLDTGTNPPAVEELCHRVDDLCLGYKLPGAGGGGFMYMVAKDPQAAMRIREQLTQNPLSPNARFVEMSISHTGLQVSRS